MFTARFLKRRYAFITASLRLLHRINILSKQSQYSSISGCDGTMALVLRLARQYSMVNVWVGPRAPKGSQQNIARRSKRVYVRDEPPSGRSPQVGEY